ncbi:hypothetical protein CRD_02429 [Raphidiopsis brookii D9]|nr:hypothetical protein CRD_02429 [Raphidiopsis brookii D9]
MGFWLRNSQFNNNSHRESAQWKKDIFLGNHPGNEHNPRDAGHFWGSDPNQKYLWGNHTRRPVPVYYQGAYSGNLTIYAGQNVKFTDSTGSTYTIPGGRGLVDQTHIFQTMKRAITGSNL